jgi:hypothetical protein
MSTTVSRATFAAVALATIAAVVSPVTVWSAIALLLIVAAGLRGLTGLERRLVIAVVVIAIAVRVALILALFATTDLDARQVASFGFDGDGRFMKVRSLWYRNMWMDLPIDAHTLRAALGRYGWTSYALVIAYVQYILGPAPYAIHLFNVCCWIGGALLLHRTLRPAFGAVAALFALTLILLLPTLVLWSAAALKESLYFLLWSIIIWGIMKLLRSPALGTRAAGLASAVAAAAALSTVRIGALAILGAGLALAAAGAFVSRRVYLMLAGIALVGTIGLVALDSAPVRQRVLPHLVLAGQKHLGNVSSEGHSYRLLDGRFYDGARIETLTWPEAKRFAVRALAGFIVVPMPHQLTSKSEILLLPQQILWYGLVLLALVGMAAGARRDLALTWLLAGFACAAAGVIALNSGNVGTLVRIRDTIVPFVACLAALGAATLGSRVAGRGAS